MHLILADHMASFTCCINTISTFAFTLAMTYNKGSDCWLINCAFSVHAMMFKLIVYCIFKTTCLVDESNKQVVRINYQSVCIVY